MTGKMSVRGEEEGRIGRSGEREEGRRKKEGEGGNSLRLIITYMHMGFNIFSVSQKVAPLKLFAVFSLLVNLCN